VDIQLFSSVPEESITPGTALVKLKIRVSLLTLTAIFLVTQRITEIGSSVRSWQEATSTLEGKTCS
jgi:hypothetical protein